ncbi:hypothetical protein CDD80_306 [Ophiocordyceps camponoti-rufipedis]|uniref:Uncharacterized protein n=1 Tax=Ophiocordyceps camponoti-rufipedis TaxID=2004952 RepID=A0A2C5ZD25_9HYPO|nr:hypothetical protein CDD80_306 [Ophiocordyceps camponoti-rufipedis]
MNLTKVAILCGLIAVTGASPTPIRYEDVHRPNVRPDVDERSQHDNVDNDAQCSKCKLDPFLREFGSQIEQEQHRIFERHGIDWTNEDDHDVFGTRTLMQGVSGYASTFKPTISIIAPWKDDSRNVWPRAVSDIKKYIDSLTNNPSYNWRHLDFAVEMVGAELVKPKYMAAIFGNQTLDNDWPDIQARVQSTLKDDFPQFESNMTCLALFRLGYVKPPELNPMTVYISVDYDCLADTWEPVIASIQQQLDATGHDLHLHIEHESEFDWFSPDNY